MNSIRFSPRSTMQTFVFLVLFALGLGMVTVAWNGCNPEQESTAFCAANCAQVSYQCVRKCREAEKRTAQGQLTLESGACYARCAVVATECGRRCLQKEKPPPKAEATPKEAIADSTESESDGELPSPDD